MKSALFERQHGNRQQERDYIHFGLSKFPTFPKLWVMAIQVDGELGNIDGAREAYNRAILHVPANLLVYVAMARVEQATENLPKARAVLEKARSRIHKNADLWYAKPSVALTRRLEIVRSELVAGNRKLAETRLVQG
jgi:pre-mRNA-processing factor 6